MHLTYRTDYSLRVLIYLAVHSEQLVSTGEISKAYSISKHHLVRVVQLLGQSGFITIQPGRTGGIKLARDPQNISLKDVVSSTEPDFHFAECFNEQDNSCPITPVCGLKAMLKEAGRAFLNKLGEYTLADIVKNRNRNGFALHFINNSATSDNKKKLITKKSNTQTKAKQRA